MGLVRYLFLTKDLDVFPSPPQNKYEILKCPTYGGKVYVKGMLVLGSEDSKYASRGGHSTTNHFGYNFKEFEVVSRDRQDTMDIRDQKANIVAAWYECCERVV